MKELAFYQKIKDWDFSGCSLQNRTATGIYSNFKEIVTNSISVVEQVASLGVSRDKITCTKKNENDTSIEVQQLRGDFIGVSEYQGKQGQLVVNTDDNTVHVMDGVNAGGTKLATENFVLSKLAELTQELENTKAELMSIKQEE